LLEEDEAMNPTCPQCGYINRVSNNFCTQCGTKLSAKNQPSLQLLVIGGADKGKKFDVTADLVHIGRDSTNDISFTDAKISSTHAKLSVENNKIWIEDLKSTNGTLVNGRKISSKTPLHDEYLVKMGNTLMKVRNRA